MLMLAEPVSAEQALEMGLVNAVVPAADLAAAAAELARVLRNRWGGWNSTLLGVGGFVVGVAVAYLVLPPSEQPPAGFPAALLWNFRLVSLGTQALLWATLGLLFGVLAERLLARRAHRAGAVTRSR
jgi:enoyl-CoA hydratase/carnithine racemase